MFVLAFNVANTSLSISTSSNSKANIAFVPIIPARIH
ncbi:uncharacterized protein METZ01_LOCUS223334, partial [marine metagenome]